MGRERDGMGLTYCEEVSDRNQIRVQHSKSDHRSQTWWGGAGSKEIDERQTCDRQEFLQLRHWSNGIRGVRYKEKLFMSEKLSCFSNLLLVELKLCVSGFLFVS
jgi:hypothetical protein